MCAAVYLITPPVVLFAHWAARRFALPSTEVYVAVLGAGWLACACARYFGIEEDGVAHPYTGTPLRVAPYFAGVGVAVAVRQHSRQPYAFPGPRARAVALLASWAVVLVAACTGAEPSYFRQTNAVGAAYAREWRPLFRAHVALGRPLLGLAVAYLLGASLTGHAPRLAGFLGHPCWRPLAALSYSVYLLQYVGSAVWTPLVSPLIDAMGLDAIYGPLWLGAILSHGKALVVLAATLPLAAANYCLVERPMHMYGRTAAEGVARACAFVQLKPRAPPQCHHGSGLL